MAKAKPDVEKKEGQTVDVLDNYIEGKVSKTYVPEGYKSREAFLEEMRHEHKADLDFDRINREAALDDKKFAAGEQWDPIVLEQRKGLPNLVINSIPQFTAQLVGDWRESRRAIKVVPANDEDQNVASVRGDLIRAIEMQSRANRTYDSAFESLVQCGDGAFRVCVEYARDDVFDQDIRIRPIEDALSVVWDRFSVDPTGRDARHVFVDDRIPKSEFRRRYPDCSPDELTSETTFAELQVEGWTDQDSYRVTEYWRLIERQRVLSMFENGKVFVVEDDNMEEIIAQNGRPIKSRLTWVTYAQMHLVTGFEILSGPYEYKLGRLPIVRMSGRVVNVGGRRVRYGLVRFMKDAVRLKNFWRSVAAEQLGYAPKAQWIATESAVEGYEEELRKAHLSRDPLIKVSDDAVIGQNIQRLDPPAPQAALLNEAQVNAQDMKDVTGIHDASLGVRSNEVSGRAIQARQREGDIASLTFYDNANEAILEAGDVINQLIPQIYDGTRIVRIIGEDETLKFVTLNDPMNPDAVDLSVGQYDVALSTGTSYTTRRVEAAQAMMDAIQVWPNLMQVAGDLVAKAQDWPGADKLAERLKKTIPPQFLEEEEGGGPGIGPEELQQLQMQLQTLAQENQQLKTDKSIDIEKLKIDAYNAQTQRIRALSDHEVDANQMEMDAIGLILDKTVELDEQDIRREDLREKYQLSDQQLQHNREASERDAAIKTSQKAQASGPSTSGGKSSPPSDSSRS